MSDRHRKHTEEERKKAAGAAPGVDEEAGFEKTGEEKAEKAPPVTLGAEEYQSLLNQVEEMRDRYLRAAADFDNFRKRAEKEKENVVCYANEKLIGELLPILDNLERALAADRNGSTVGGILEGVHLVRQQLQSVLAACGLEPVDAVGTPFDPMLHEAVGVLPSESHEEGTVVSELQKGYKLKGKVLRHSMVHVAGGHPDKGSREEER